MNNNKVLAMYDVRGIQDYIFRTSKMKDAIGASSIVENLFEEALKDASEKLGLSAELAWCDDKNAKIYTDNSDKDVVVLYVGGGNACVLYINKDVAVKMNREMSRYTLDKTYSLQLAVAMVEKTESYKADYENLMAEMVRVKDRMMVNKPLDALPIMKVETKTGLPVTRDGVSTESNIKTKAGDDSRKHVRFNQKLFDNYVEGKGESSMLAVVHIDGNNMGLRIRELISGIDSYDEAVTEMRKISYSINSSYKKVFADMEETFSTILENVKKEDKHDQSKWWIMKVIDAGDDITYVCNANIAFATVEYFCKNISKYSLKPESGNRNYRFSACAGISYFNSHFPFNIAYNVAEECCESAKSRAKEEKHMDGKLVGNWVDFQFCRSVHARNLKRIRTEEYRTSAGEDLLRRPYFIYSEHLDGEVGDKFKTLDADEISYNEFARDIKKYVQSESNLPRSFVKEMRNTYPLGSNQMKILWTFLKSRETSEKMDGKKVEYPKDLYFDYEGKKVAKYYDAMEVAEYFRSFDDLSRVPEKEEKQK